MVAALLALLGLGELWALFRRASRDRLPVSAALPALLASAAAGAFVVLASEVLSLLGRFDRPGIVVAWALLDLALAPILIRGRSGARFLPDARKPGPWLLRGSAVATWLLLLPLVPLVAQTNHDTHTYHLPRVMAWLQQGSLAPFPTNDFRRLDFAPFASMAVAHAYALGDGDRLVGAVQWAATGGLLVAVSALAAWLLSRARPGEPFEERAAGLAALFAVTLPVLLVQATTCQNDATGAFWLAASVALGAHLLDRPGSLLLAAGSATAFALAVLTKETNALAGAPLALFGALWLALRGRRPVERLAWPAALALAVALLFPGHLSRRAAAFGSPLGSAFARETVLTADRSPSAVVSGLLRGASLYTATGSRPVTDALAAGLERLLRLTGRPLQDPATVYGREPFSFQDEVVVNDSVVNTPWSLAALLLALGLLPSRRVPARARLAGLAALALLGGVLVTAAVRWQVQLVRFHLSTLVLLAPVVGVVLATALPRPAVAAVAVLLLGNGWYALLVNETRPLVPPSRLLARPREEQLFAAIPEAYPAYRAVATSLAALGCRDVGLDLAFLEMEYPLWALLGGAGGPFRLRYVGPEAAVPPPPRAGAPCAVVTSRTSRPDEVVPVPSGAVQPGLPDVADFGHLRLHVAPPASERWRLTVPGPGGRLVGLGQGQPVTLPPRGAPLLLWTYRPGVLEVELDGGPGLGVVDGSGHELRIASRDGAAASVALPVAGGVSPLTFVRAGARETGGPLTLRRAIFRPAGEGWTALFTVGRGLVPYGARPTFAVGAVPVPVELLSRRGGVLRLLGRLQAGAGRARLGLTFRGEERLLDAPGPLDVTLPTGVPRARILLRAVGSEGAQVRVEGLLVALAGGPGPT